MAETRYAFSRRLFARNRGLKVLSVLLAAISWYAVRTVIGVTITMRDIPVVVKVREGMAVVSQSPATVTVDFKGSQEEIAQVEELHNRGQIQAVVDARVRTVPAKEMVAVHPHNVEGAKGARAVRVHRPSEIVVDLDVEDEKYVLVRPPEYRGAPGVGRVTLVDRAPASVRVRGPRSRLAGLLQVASEPVDVGGATESFERAVRVVAAGNPWITRIEPPEVTALVTIERTLASRTLADVPVGLLVRPAGEAGVEISPAAVKVLLSGGAQEIQGLTRDNVRALADCTGLGEAGQGDLPVRIFLPEGCGASASAEPRTVRAFVRKAR